MGLDRITSGLVGIGQNFFRGGWNWTEFIAKCVGLVLLFAGMCSIGWNFYEGGQIDPSGEGGMKLYS